MKALFSENVDRILILMYLAVAASSTILVPMIILQRNPVII